MEQHGLLIASGLKNQDAKSSKESSNRTVDVNMFKVMYSNQ